ncbi:MAG: HAMP domain-containing histidine kinase [Lachnospiraceae bacterium]|jgi:signal transduction histidine kinase|nr:HAMP domain-containing histidine kinase [Lachnospiraceae bacterium]MCI9094607.1 HAMP domain-containing histidine kinase [Lachnospiraceae bacterium]
MKFSSKLLFCTMIVMAIALGFSGFYFVDSVFEISLERETGQALDENSILCFAFETAALNVPAKYDVLQDSTVEQLASKLESSGQNASRMLRISNEEKQALYASDGFEMDDALLSQTDASTKAYRTIYLNGHYYVQTASTVNALDRVLYLETLRDVSVVFDERAMGFRVYRQVTVVMLLLGMAAMHLISFLLTKPIRHLTRATKKMAAGDYAYRARKVSNDELGQLTLDFNHMAEALEENINKLEDEIQAKEDFVGAFAHELKTPLTAIIGYADMLRSRKLDEEKSFLSANYIYTEGKRLEAMSIRLLDIMVTRHGQAQFQEVQAESLFQYLQAMFRTNEDMNFVYTFEEGIVWAESNLIITVLINLMDNAVKASEPGSTIEVKGMVREKGYLFQVKDYGMGIAEEEIQKITKAFYMVDKSRARERNGAGLGLALCAEILSLHHSSLSIESKLGEGTCIGFLLPEQERKSDE